MHRFAPPAVVYRPKARDSYYLVLITIREGETIVHYKTVAKGCLIPKLCYTYIIRELENFTKNIIFQNFTLLFSCYICLIYVKFFYWMKFMVIYGLQHPNTLFYSPNRTKRHYLSEYRFLIRNSSTTRIRR